MRRHPELIREAVKLMMEGRSWTQVRRLFPTIPGRKLERELWKAGVLKGPAAGITAKIRARVRARLEGVPYAAYLAAALLLAEKEDLGVLRGLWEEEAKELGGKEWIEETSQGGWPWLVPRSGWSSWSRGPSEKMRARQARFVKQRIQRETREEYNARKREERHRRETRARAHRERGSDV